MNKLLQKRFDELVHQAAKVEETKKKEYDRFSSTQRERIDEQMLLSWTVKAQDTLTKVCGPESQHYRKFAEAALGGMYRTNLDNFKNMKTVFLAAKDDFEGGYLVDAHDLIRAEVFGSELEQASEFLKKGYATAAAVIAGVVLETTLRELCSRNHIAPNTLGRMNDDLAKAGFYSGVTQKRITHLAGIRNSAAHGKPEEFTAEDVNAMISDIERFLSQHLA